MRHVLTWSQPWFSTRLSFFFFNDTPTTEIYTLSLHDALPIWVTGASIGAFHSVAVTCRFPDIFSRALAMSGTFRSESTRLNSSHMSISDAVFCLKKKKTYSIQ